MILAKGFDVRWAAACRIVGKLRDDGIELVLTDEYGGVMSMFMPAKAFAELVSSASWLLAAMDQVAVDRRRADQDKR
jgi:hypothetical protein